MNAATEQTEEIFEQFKDLYQEDPDEFEAQRDQLIRETIESFPEESRQRAYGLQFTIDAQLSKYKDPLVRMNKMVEIFWEQFAVFQSAVTDPKKFCEEKEEAEPAKVIPFRKH